jgi:serine acetyltransferase
MTRKARASTIRDHRHPARTLQREPVEGRQVPRAVRRPAGLGALLAYEAAMLLASWVPGALGLVLRSKMYPMILGSVGRNVVFGVNVTLRHPHKIHIGDNVVIDDLCCLDAKGTDNQGITIGNGVFVGRNTILSCKNGDIIIEDRANIGSTARSSRRRACASARTS